MLFKYGRNQSFSSCSVTRSAYHNHFNVHNKWTANYDLLRNSARFLCCTVWSKPIFWW